MSIRRIGFIGIGNMGSPMAAHLVAAGFDVTVYDARPEVVSIFVERHGGRAAEWRAGRGIAGGARRLV